MTEADKQKVSIRPNIPQAELKSDMSPAERFQNETLRPILKFQHSLFLALFRHYFSLKKDAFFDISKEQRAAYIDKHILKDSKIRNELRGIVIGQFTVAEYAAYTEQSSALNRRMMQMIRERVLDGCST